MTNLFIYIMHARLVQHICIITHAYGDDSVICKTYNLASFANGFYLCLRAYVLKYKLASKLAKSIY